jgi:uncharacterized protein YndB with AHSA1/START domain
MLKKAILDVAAFLVATAVSLALAAATRPTAFQVVRTTVIGAPPDRVYAEIDDFHRWVEWMPWSRLDPNQTTVHEGHGVGASYYWKGNDRVGEGRMTITDADPGRRVVIRLEFLAPMKSVATTEVSLAPVSEGTRTTWSMTGDLDFVGKLFSLFSSMDRMIGPDFEKGLAQLRKRAEAPSPAAPTPPPQSSR